MKKQPSTHAELELLKQKKLNDFYKVKDNPNTITKDVDTTKRVVTGVANTFYFYDSDGDILISGCADKTMAERGPDSNGPAKIKNVKDHVITNRIGVPQVLREDTVGGNKVQYFESKMYNNTMGNDMLVEYQEGGIDQHSIGFRYVDLDLVTADDEEWSKWMAMIINPDDAEEHGYAFIVKEIAQFEWSPVSFGANELTPYLGVKSGNKDGLLLKLFSRIDHLEKQLRGGKQTEDMLMDHELECRQLKQIIGELFTTQPSLKDTLLEGRQPSDTSDKDSSMRICPSCLKQFVAPAGPANCKNCGKYVPASDMVVPFDVDKAIKETKFLIL